MAIFRELVPKGLVGAFATTDIPDLDLKMYQKKPV